MSEAYNGGCACGAVRYEISAEPVFMNHCQCLDCQRRSGTGHGSYLTFAGRQSVKLEGKAAHCDVVADSGNVKTHGFCPACGSPVYLTFAAMPDPVHRARGEPRRSRPVQAAGRHLRGARSRLGPSRSGACRNSTRCRRRRVPELRAKILSCACRLWRFPFVLKGEAPKRRFGMDHSRYRWVIVAAGGMLGCVAIGAMFSLPVLLQSIARDTGWSVAGVSSAMTIGFLAMACLQHALGHAVRPLRAAAGGADGIDRAGGQPFARQPGDLAARIPVHLRRRWSAARSPRSLRR